MADSLLIAADKYKIDSLQLVCEKYLITTLTAPNAAQLYSLAHNRACQVLKQKCLEFVKEHMSEVMGSGGWAQHVASHAEMLNDVLAYIAGMPQPGSGSAKRPRLE